MVTGSHRIGCMQMAIALQESITRRMNISWSFVQRSWEWNMRKEALTLPFHQEMALQFGVELEETEQTWWDLRDRRWMLRIRREIEWTVATKRKILLLCMIMGGEGLSCAGQLHGVHLHVPTEEKILNIRQQEILDRYREGSEARSVWGHVFSAIQSARQSAEKYSRSTCQESNWQKFVDLPRI